MTTSDPSARELLSSLEMVQGAMDRMTAANLSELLSSRFKSKVALQAFLTQLEGRCSRLRVGTPAQAASCRSIDRKVSALGAMVNTHVARWNPAAISADLDGYKAAVANLFREIRSITTEARTLPAW